MYSNAVESAVGWITVRTSVMHASWRQSVVLFM